MGLWGTSGSVPSVGQQRRFDQPLDGQEPKQADKTIWTDAKQPSNEPRTEGADPGRWKPIRPTKGMSA
ncbi:MAG: hypothetical protein NZ602_14630 [Thermoguttaceae bacterium]|nr:hypothetical protein [Thermoguttaceae bacterium]MDW8036534.1 hypothetical protein [Thermoguttaceae bacterium]